MKTFILTTALLLTLSAPTLGEPAVDALPAAVAAVLALPQAVTPPIDETESTYPPIFCPDCI